MTKTVISPEEGEELAACYAELGAATNRLADICATKGMGSSEFLEADRVVGVIIRRIREILGSPDHWMA
jgi:hypothetical protein